MHTGISQNSVYQGKTLAADEHVGDHSSLGPHHCLSMCYIPRKNNMNHVRELSIEKANIIMLTDETLINAFVGSKVSGKHGNHKNSFHAQLSMKFQLLIKAKILKNKYIFEVSNSQMLYLAS